jgi:sulfur carrier protein
MPGELAKELSIAAVSLFKTERDLMGTRFDFIPIFVNDSPRQQSVGSTLASLLDDLKVPVRTGIAVAVNDEVVRKVDWTRRELQAQDRVLIISASQGG